MVLYCLLTTALLLLTIEARVYFDEAEPGIEAAASDFRDYPSKPSREKQLELYKHLLTGRWPILDPHPDENSIDNESVEKGRLGKAWYELYKHNMYGMMQVQAKNFPSVPEAEVGLESPVSLEVNHVENDASSEELIDVSDSNLDQIVDFILGLVNMEIAAKGKDQIPVPDISEEFEKKVGFVKLHGKFDAQNGWFKNLSTIQRTGDVVATRRGLYTLVITCSMGLSTMQFGFDSYQANLAGISVRGRMTGSVASNSVTLQVAASFVAERCNITLEQVTVDRFDGLNVDLTGLGDLSWLLDSIVGWVTKHFKDEIVSSIDENINKAITDVLAKYHCSELSDLVQYLPRRETGQEISVAMV